MRKQTNYVMRRVRLEEIEDTQPRWAELDKILEERMKEKDVKPQGQKDKSRDLVELAQKYQHKIEARKKLMQSITSNFGIPVDQIFLQEKPGAPQKYKVLEGKTWIYVAKRMELHPSTEVEAPVIANDAVDATEIAARKILTKSLWEMGELIDVLYRLRDTGRTVSSLFNSDQSDAETLSVLYDILGKRTFEDIITIVRRGTDLDLLRLSLGEPVSQIISKIPAELKRKKRAEKAQKAYNTGLDELTKSNPDFDCAIKNLKTAVATVPNNLRYKIILLRALNRKGDNKSLNEAEKISANLRLKNFPPALCCELAHLRLKQAKYSEAIDLLEKAIELDPYYAPAYINLGQTLHDQGDKKRALNVLNVAIKNFGGAHRESETVELYFNRAKMGLSILQENPNEAQNLRISRGDILSDLKQCLSVNPFHPEANMQMASLLYRFSSQEIALGEGRQRLFAQIFSHLRKVADSSKIWPLYQAAKSYHKLGKKKQADIICGRLKILAPEIGQQLEKELFPTDKKAPEVQPDLFPNVEK